MCIRAQRGGFRLSANTEPKMDRLRDGVLVVDAGRHSGAPCCLYNTCDLFVSRTYPKVARRARD